MPRDSESRPDTNAEQVASGHTEEHRVCCCPLRAHDQRAPSQMVYLSPQGWSPIQNFTAMIHTHKCTHTCWSRDPCLSGMLTYSELHHNNHTHTHNPCWSRDPCQGCSPIQNFTITITNNTQHTHTHTCWSRDLCLGILLISELSPCCTISSAWIPRFQICILLPRCDLAYLASWRPLCHFIFSKCQYFIVGLLIPNSVPSCSPCPAPVQF